MTRKDYIVAAQFLSDAKRRVDKGMQAIDLLYYIQERFMLVAKDNNSQFDRDRFMKACGFGD